MDAAFCAASMFFVHIDDLGSWGRFHLFWGWLSTENTAHFTPFGAEEAVLPAGHPAVLRPGRRERSPPATAPRAAGSSQPRPWAARGRR